MDRLGQDVERELARFGPQAGLGQIVERWPKLVGEAIARNAWPARVQRDGTLLVHAASAAWAFELTQLEPSIRERLAGLIQGRLRFVPGPLPELGAAMPSETTAIVPEVAPEDRRDGESLASAIEDEKLRKLVARAAAASLAKARSGRVF
jgi:hypothetical protein